VQCQLDETAVAKGTHITFVNSTKEGPPASGEDMIKGVERAGRSDDVLEESHGTAMQARAGNRSSRRSKPQRTDLAHAYITVVGCR